MKEFNQKPENIYDDGVTRQYYETFGKDVKSSRNEAEADKYLKSLIPPNLNNQSVLDHGCGNGRYGELFCQRGAKRVLGVDLSSSMLQEATKRKDEKQLQQLEFVQGDINNLPVGKEKFDFIFSRFSLGYSPNISKVMKEISESLKEDGEILIETNVASIKNNKDEIQKSAIPLTLRLGKSEVPIKTFAVTMAEYLNAFEYAGLNIQIEKEYPAAEITINDSYEYKNLVDFKVFVYKVTKKNKIKNKLRTTPYMRFKK